jgi:hypothetical protein
MSEKINPLKYFDSIPLDQRAQHQDEVCKLFRTITLSEYTKSIKTKAPAIRLMIARANKLRDENDPRLEHLTCTPKIIIVQDPISETVVPICLWRWLGFCQTEKLCLGNNIESALRNGEKAAEIFVKEHREKVHREKLWTEYSLIVSKKASVLDLISVGK